MNPGLSRAGAGKSFLIVEERTPDNPAAVHRTGFKSEQGKHLPVPKTMKSLSIRVRGAVSSHPQEIVRVLTQLSG